MSTLTVPAATKPTRVIRRAGKHWSVAVRDSYDFTDPPNTTSLHRGLVVARWTGTRGTVTCTAETWDEAAVNDLWADEISDMQREAVEAMPKAVMRDVSVSAATRGHAVVQPGRGAPTADVGITALAREVQRLVVDMARYDSPSPAVQAEFARRYGRYRDAMAKLRQEFTAAEGAFEVAQAMLVDFMDGDDA